MRVGLAKTRPQDGLPCSCFSKYTNCKLITYVAADQLSCSPLGPPQMTNLLYLHD